MIKSISEGKIFKLPGFKVSRAFSKNYLNFSKDVGLKFYAS